MVKNKRGSGILLHISSLPSKYGIGTLGKEAYRFIDFLEAANQKYWQILPLGHTGYGDSPYQSFSIYAGNPYFVDLEMLVDMGLLFESDFEETTFNDNDLSVDYGCLFENKYKLLKKAYKNFDKNNEKYIDFIKENRAWLDDYALFMSIKAKHDNKPWIEWEEKYRFREERAIAEYVEYNKEEVEYWKCIQYLFYTQWNEVKKYANDKDIKIIGDVPIYVAYDSVDVWTNPSLFDLKDDLTMNTVAGCPPDCFSATGQLWGNPIYNWELMQESGYEWWCDRLKFVSNIYDIVRIDHFRGFESYYAISAEEDTAINGQWIKGPDKKFFDHINSVLPDINIIAEDLGFLTDEVRDLLNYTKYPGMKLLRYAFENYEDNMYLPHNYTKNCVVYIGTHDSDTAIGWLKNTPEHNINYMKEYLDINEDDFEGIVWKLIARAYQSVGDIVIIQFQDYLCKGNEARMNMPSTLGGNWTWRIAKEDINDYLAKRINRLASLYKRC